MSNVKLIKGYFEETVGSGKGREMYKNEKCAVVFLDCDLMNPTLVALQYVQPILQPGSIIILDDYFAYHGDENLGTCGAFDKFLQQYPNVHVREFSDYGYGGKSFIVTRI